MIKQTLINTQSNNTTHHAKIIIPINTHTQHHNSRHATASKTQSITTHTSHTARKKNNTHEHTNANPTRNIKSHKYNQIHNTK
jgi:hypothetical protein